MSNSSMEMIALELEDIKMEVEAHLRLVRARIARFPGIPLPSLERRATALERQVEALRMAIEMCR